MFRKLAGLTAVAGLFIAGTASAAITGTAHDLSANGYTGGEICIVCHTTHNTDTTVSDSPLWNHEVTAATYTLYASSTLQSAPGQPVGVSKLCLSCHDGTVAIDSFGGGTGSTFVGTGADVGTDLADDHPIAMTYDAALNVADPEMADPTATASGVPGSSGNIDDDMLFGAGNDQLECASCHDVHGGVVNTPLLVKDNADSALCLTCHIK